MYSYTHYTLEEPVPVTNSCDILHGCDSVPDRKVLHYTVNQHGYDILEFLNESKLCVLNGRFNELKDSIHRFKERQVGCGFHLYTPGRKNISEGDGSSKWEQQFYKTNHVLSVRNVLV